MQNSMRSAPTVLFAVIASALIGWMFWRFMPLTTRSYYSELPLTISARGAVSVDMEVEGKTVRMVLLLFSPDTLLAEQPHEIDEWLLKTEPHPGYYKAHHTWPPMDAAVRLGAYRRTTKVAPMSPAWAATGDQGGLGSAMFQPLDPNESPRVTLDVRAKKMILFWRPDRPKMQAGPDDVVLPYKADRVQLSIGGRAPLPFGIDLTLPTTSLSETDAKLLGRTRKHPFGKPLPLLVGKRAWLIAGIPYAGDINILGKDVLQNYRITIDYRDNMILFEPYPAIPGEQRAVPGK